MSEERDEYMRRQEADHDLLRMRDPAQAVLPVNQETISDHTLTLMSRRDAVDAEFIAYSGPRVWKANIEVLASLALIGGRLDRMLARSLASDRRNKRVRT